MPEARLSQTPPTLFGLRDTLRLRLGLFSLALVLPLLGLLGLGIRKKFVDDRAAAADRLHTQRVLVEQTLNSYLTRIRTKLLELEKIVGFTDLDSVRAHEQCREFLRLHPEFINVGVVDREGTLRFSAAFPVSNPPQNFRTLPGLKEHFGTTEFIITKAARGIITGRWGCVAVVPLRSNPQLLLAAPIDLHALSRRLFFGPDTPHQIVTVTDRNLTVVLSSYTPDTRIGQVRPGGKIVRDRLAAGQNTGEFVGVDGVARTYDSATLPLADWVITVAEPTEEIYAAAWQDARASLVAVGLVLLAGLILIRLYSHALLRPVVALANVARDHAAGQRERLAPVKGPAEIADTAHAFNEMVLARRRTEAELIASELRYRTIVEQTGQIVYDLDLASGRKRWFGEQAIVSITGHAPEEFAAESVEDWAKLIHPEERGAVLAIFNHSRTEARPFLAEYRFRHRDGSYHVIEDFGVFLRDDTGHVNRMLGRLSDISGRRRAEAALRESEDRYRTVIEQTGQMVYQVDITTGRMQWFGNEAVRAITGYSIADLQQRSVAEFGPLLHPDDAPRASAFFQERRHQGGSYHLEYRLRHQDGSYRLVEDNGVFLADATGRIVRSLGRLSDITERTRILREITQRQRLLRQVIDLVPHFIFAKDRDGRFLLANESLAQAHGLTVAQMIGRTDRDFHPDPTEVAAYHAADLKVIDGQERVFVPEETHTDARGVKRIVSTIKIPFTFSDETRDIPALLGVAVDISELKRAQSERQQLEKKLLEAQKLESLGVLAGGIAHDFNNLLTGVLGNAGLARLDLPASTPVREQIDQIERAAQRAADLCKQMLAYSGKGRFVVQAIDLNELVEESLGLLTVSVSKKAVLRFNPGTSLPPIQADATQLRQIVMNLVINASEALEDHTGQITLHTGALTVDASYLATAQFTGEITPGPAVFLEVSDTGCGMPRETLTRIFDPFFTTKFTGRGLGLAAVLGIVRGHKGAIKVYSEPRAGTTFRILFPATQGTAQPLARPATEHPTWRGSGCVLVIDDEEPVRQVSTGILRVLGFDTDSAHDGAEGIARFRADPDRFVAVLLDLTMPHVDGEETFRQLRLLRPGVKVILMSGFNRVDAVNRFVGKGLAGFVQKPFQVETLAAELQRVLTPEPK